MKFKLEIEMGNAAMKDGEDLAAVFEKLAAHLRRWDATTGDAVTIRDDNGNTVGRWEVVAEVDPASLGIDTTKDGWFAEYKRQTEGR